MGKIILLIDKYISTVCNTTDDLIKLNNRKLKFNFMDERAIELFSNEIDHSIFIYTDIQASPI